MTLDEFMKSLTSPSVEEFIMYSEREFFENYPDFDKNRYKLGWDLIGQDLEECLREESGYFEKVCDQKSFVQCYQCQKEIFDTTGKSICVDKCLADEIRFLWSQGITTTGCCCGCHVNSYEDSAYIGVEFKDIDKMKKLGYTVKVNPLRPNDEDSFSPKTYIYRRD